MSSGYVYFKGNNDEINEIGLLISQINDVCREGSYYDYIDDDSDKNILLKNFFSNYLEIFGDDNFYYISGVINHYAQPKYQDRLIFNHSEKLLDICGSYNEIFLIDEWVDLLIKTFPKISFFFVGEVNNDNCFGMGYRIYEKKKIINSEDYYLILDDYDVPDQFFKEFSEYLEILELAQNKIWRISGSDEQLIKEAKSSAKAAQKKLRKIISQIENINNQMKDDE